MKRTVALFLVLVMAATLAAGCGRKKDKEKAPSVESPLVLLEQVWGKYAEEDKFFARGGDFSEENMKENAPGKYSLADAEAVNSELGLPAAGVSMVEEAASLIHGMNANTFTCGAFQLKNSGDAEQLVSVLKDSIQGRNWICGTPETLLIATLGDHVVAVFGADQLVQTFKTNLQAAYASAEISLEEAIV